MSESRNPYLVLIGPPGCGKTTWAKANFSRTEVVSSDALRAMVADRPGNMLSTPYAFRALYAIAEGRADLGKTTVVDATNRTRYEREKAALPALRFNRPAIAVVFVTPLEVCLERNHRRPKWRRVPPEWVTETHAMITADFDPATTWSEHPFSGVLFVRHEAHGYAGGSLTMKKYEQAPWMDCAREAPPSWHTGPDRWPGYHWSGWAIEGAGWGAGDRDAGAA